MAWINPIYDRTQEDIQNLTYKAYLNYDDFNRIEGNIQFLNEIVERFVNIGINAVSDWTVGDIITQKDFDRISNYINKLMSIVTSDKFIFSIIDYEKINELEKIIYNLKDKLSVQTSNILFCDNMSLTNYMEV